MKTYEQFNCEKIYWCINVNEFEDCLEKINNICKIDLDYYKKIYKNLINQDFEYAYIHKHYMCGWNPLIYNNLNIHRRVDILYKDNKFEFGGYINCTKEEVETYIEFYEIIKKYNL